jgi:hypothetical protein
MRRGPTRRARCAGAWLARACLLAALVSVPATAAPTVLLVPFAHDEQVSADEAQRVTHAVSLQLDAADAVRPFGEKPLVADPLAGPLDQARTLIARRKFSEARTVLTQAIANATRGDSGATASTVAQAQLTLGALDLRAGNERGARTAFEAAIGIEPSVRLPKGQFPPLVSREVERARARMAHAPRTKVSFDGPSGAEVKIDGRGVGSLPAAQARLTAGPHRLDASSEEGQLTVWFEAAGSTLRLPLVFPPGTGSPTTGLADALGDGLLTDALAQLLSARLRTIGADAALVALVSRHDADLRVEAALYVASHGGFTLLAPVELDGSLRTVDAQALRLVDEVAAGIGSPSEALALPIDLATGRAPQPKDAVAVAPKSATLTPRAAGSPPAALGPAAVTSSEGQGSFFSRVPTWAWIAGGVALAAGAGGATYYAISRANRGPTGTVAATW